MSQLILPRRLREGRTVIGPRKQRGFMLIDPYKFAVSASFYSIVMANGPVNYWRNGEASGGGSGTMVDEVAASGTYAGGVSLGNTALYTGGPTTAGGNFSSTIYGASTAFPAALNSMTIISIIRPTNLSGLHLIGVQRDNNAGGRKWQWRSNGAHMDFIKVVGGVVTLQTLNMFVVNTTYLVGFEISAVGAWAMYLNGVQVGTGTGVAAANYGGAGDPYRIGYASGAATNLTGTTCENAVFDKVLGPSVHAALAAAAGL